MKDINFTSNNLEKIEAAIKEAEGKARKGKIDVNDIKDAIEYIEKKLGIAKKDMIGIAVDVDLNARTLPNSYKYTAESTHFCLIRKKSCWCITRIYRGEVSRPEKKYEFLFTEQAKQAIIDSKTYMS